MDMKIEEWVVALAIYVMYLVVLCFNLGFSEGLHLNATIIMSLIWLVLFVAVVALLVVSVLTAVTSVLLYFGEADDNGYVVGVSVIALILAFCLGEASSFFTRGAPDFASVMSFGSLWSVFWKPYLSAYVISFALWAMMKIWKWYEAI